MEARVKVSAKSGETVDLVLEGPSKAVQELIQRLRAMGGPLDVAGGTCCWSLSRPGATVHVVVDTDRMAS
jgi:hypothetical protein